MSKKTVQEIIIDIENADLTDKQLERIIKIAEHKKRLLDMTKTPRPILAPIVAETIEQENEQLWTENVKLHDFLGQAHTDITNMYRILEAEDKLHVIREGETFSPYYTTEQLRLHERIITEHSANFINKILAFNTAMDDIHGTFQSVCLIGATTTNKDALQKALVGIVGELGKEKSELIERHRAIPEALQKDISNTIGIAATLQGLITEVTSEGQDGNNLRRFLVEYGNEKTKELISIIDEVPSPGRKAGMTEERRYIFDLVNKERVAGKQDVTWNQAGRRAINNLRKIPENQRFYLDQYALEKLEKLQSQGNLGTYMNKLKHDYEKTKNL